MVLFYEENIFLYRNNNKLKIVLRKIIRKIFAQKDLAYILNNYKQKLIYFLMMLALN